MSWGFNSSKIVKTEFKHILISNNKPIIRGRESRPYMDEPWQGQEKRLYDLFIKSLEPDVVNSVYCFSSSGYIPDSAFIDGDTKMLIHH
ncbi:1376_t:CDS:2 [Paraglomus brasilianum]|uniref:1376_t:CDS:1 n=1 Tax=Paraglomus brasilianum TaxID=144538 RepID=A0A9N8ZJK3_9GLOM|nr:1376_t:CDS:2 [Paraglomus brasilianum]